METYELIRSRRKTLALELTADGRLLVRAPLRLSKTHIEAFIERKAGWIARARLRQAERRSLALPEPTPEETEALRRRAKEVLPEKVAYWSRRMGVRPAGLRITTARHRYGSCSGKNSLCFSCYLMRFPEEAVELVVVHELCHIREHNHGPGFYALLEQWLPDWRERKKLLGS